ncbi:MAG: chromosome segregation and condensation protein ScpA [Thermoleophilia bacterium]|jgi:segregation and condensation protein A|nr:chromosome segregation and condensation protein ScpA [Thermoleophilia bacterium]
MRPAALQLDLDTFGGPFDLLCTLLLRREFGVEDVALAEVVVSYVAQLSEQERVDPDTASEFLLLVASLMEIKARELLSQESELEIVESGSVDAQEDMLERLVRYSTFKQAAQWLAAGAGRQRWWRVASRPVRRKKEGVYEGPVMDPALLAKSMGVLLAQRDVDIRHLVGRHASVSEMTGRLLTALRQRTKFTLDEAVEGLNRLDQAVAFVAALELCKNGHVELRQDARFGPIEVSRREAAGDGDGEAAADGAAGETEFQTA